MITVHGLRYTYPKADEPAVDGLELGVERAEIFGLLGPNGAGKSTTQKILIGLLRGYAGEVSVLGRPLAEWGPDYYERIGVAFEFPSHFLKLTGRENLTYFGALYRDGTLASEKLLEWVDLAADADVPVSHYSKGMKVRLSVARALLNDPDLLFLDEPSAGLDPVSARRIKELVRAQRDAGKTVFLTTHDMVLADELCDRVAFIVDGRIELIDTPRRLERRYGERRVRIEHAGEGGVERSELPLEGLGENPEFLDILRRREIETIHTLEASLDDIFVRVTGRRLR